jgi:septum formation protein
MKKLVLASQSPRRKMLLEQVGIPFTVLPADVDETIDEGITPVEYVEILASRKADFIARKLHADPSVVVLAADTIVVYRDVILGKPKDKREAFETLSVLAGNWHTVMTGIKLIDIETGAELTHVENTRVKIRPLTKEAIINYINTGEPMDKAGAYGVQGIGALLVEKLDGCYFNVVGLPLYSVSVMLARVGIKTILDNTNPTVKTPVSIQR